MAYLYSSCTAYKVMQVRKCSRKIKNDEHVIKTKINLKKWKKEIRNPTHDIEVTG